MECLSRIDAIKLLKEYLPVKELLEADNVWRGLENNLKCYVPVHYAYYNVIYQKKYFEAVYASYEDISVVIYGGGKPVALWPIAFWRNGEVYHLGSNGMALLPPLFVTQELTTEACRKIIEKCLKFVDSLSKKMNISECLTRDVIMDSGVSDWSQKIMEKGAFYCGINTECFVNLSLDRNQILSFMRRTNRYSIEKAKHFWKAEIINRESGKEKSS